MATSPDTKQQQQEMEQLSSASTIVSPSISLLSDNSIIREPLLKETIGNNLRRRRRNAAENADGGVDGNGGGGGGGGEATTKMRLPLPGLSKHLKRSARGGIVAGRKEVMEIESGVEMLEDTIPLTTDSHGVPLLGVASGSHLASSSKTAVTKQKKHAHIIIDRDTDSDDNDDNDDSDGMTTAAGAGATIGAKAGPSSWASLVSLAQSFGSRRRIGRLLVHSNSAITVTRKSIPFYSIFGFAVVMMLPMHEFLRGVLACLLTLSILDATYTQLQSAAVRLLTSQSAERSQFQVPDYSKLPICEIPAVEEHKTVKSYTGWMNEMDSYDPNNFHISMTKSIYVKLDGSILRISNTSARIAKRAMWNEPPLERKAIQFTRHRTFDMTGCRIELLPVGLARKRYFNRKYPIQLIMRQTMESNADLATMPSFHSAASTFKMNETNEDALQNVPSTFAFNSRMHLNSDTTGISLNHPVEEKSEQQQQQQQQQQLGSETEMDFAEMILNADLQTLHEPEMSEVNSRDMTIPYGDEVRILLFARADREKEDWYRRFVAASAGNIHDQDLRLPHLKFIESNQLTSTLNSSRFELLSNFIPKRDDGGIRTVASTQRFGIDAEESHMSFLNSQMQFFDAENPDEEEQRTEMAPMEVTATDVDRQYEGLIMSSCIARNPIDYIRFMSMYQNACSYKTIPVLKILDFNNAPVKRRRRSKRRAEELWKGIDQSLFLGPSGSLVWANVLVGRILYSCLNDNILKGRIQEFLQKKLNSVKLPSFMEDVTITQIYLGDTPPLIHRVSQPLLDERGTWMDADVTYEGLLHITVTTKLNLLRVKQKKNTNLAGSSVAGGGGGNNTTTGSGVATTATATATIATTTTTTTTTTATVTTATATTSRPIDADNATSSSAAAAAAAAAMEAARTKILVTSSDSGDSGGGGGGGGSGGGVPVPPINIITDTGESKEATAPTTTTSAANAPTFVTFSDARASINAIFDSDAESSGGSSSEGDVLSSASGGVIEPTASEYNVFQNSPNNARRFLKIVDRLTTSNIFQYAADLSYVQRAMETMNANITLRVELKGLVSRAVVNIPPPPSDRIWLCFRGPPRLWISAKPAFGDKSVDWTIITNIIENKLCEEVNKFLVYPNMVDIMLPFLGQTIYRE